MKNKPNYKGYVLYQREINKLGISQSCNDLLDLHIKFHIPFPKDAIQDGRIRRDDLVEKLTNYWRIAENWYLKTGSDILKLRTKKMQDRLHLNEYEIKLLEEQCNSLGI